LSGSDEFTISYGQFGESLLQFSNPGESFNGEYVCHASNKIPKLSESFSQTAVDHEVNIFSGYSEKLFRVAFREEGMLNIMHCFGYQLEQSCFNFYA